MQAMLHAISSSGYVCDKSAEVVMEEKLALHQTHTPHKAPKVIDSLQATCLMQGRLNLPERVFAKDTEP